MKRCKKDPALCLAKFSMKTQIASMVMGSLSIADGIRLNADPMLDSWLTQSSGLYA